MDQVAHLPLLPEAGFRGFCRHERGSRQNIQYQQGYAQQRKPHDTARCQFWQPLGHCRNRQAGRRRPPSPHLPPGPTHVGGDITPVTPFLQTPCGVSRVTCIPKTSTMLTIDRTGATPTKDGFHLVVKQQVFIIFKRCYAATTLSYATPQNNLCNSDSHIITFAPHHNLHDSDSSSIMLEKTTRSTFTAACQASKCFSTPANELKSIHALPDCLTDRS
jgi:hypothetical protein